MNLTLLFSLTSAKKMTLQVPPELVATVQGFLDGGRYKDEVDVLSRALAELKRSEDDLADIQAGMDDEAAGRVESARDVVDRARRSLDGHSS
jgi:Arc/MetJ-type ribon-helix-helix transcriptional regulator